MKKVTKKKVSKKKVTGSDYDASVKYLIQPMTMEDRMYAGIKGAAIIGGGVALSMYICPTEKQFENTEHKGRDAMAIGAAVIIMTAAMITGTEPLVSGLVGGSKVVEIDKKKKK